MISEYYPGQVEKSQDEHDAWCANRLRLYVQELGEFDEETLRKAFRRILVEKKSQSWPSVKDCIDACRAVSSPTVTRFDGGNSDFADALEKHGVGRTEARRYASMMRISQAADGVEIDVSGARSLKTGESEGGVDLSSWAAFFLYDNHRGPIARACKQLHGTYAFEITDGRRAFSNGREAIGLQAEENAKREEHEAVA
ncbi:MAG: hypothetical protein AAF360_10020 [Pseudomonadota bacterium]